MELNENETTLVNAFRSHKKCIVEGWQLILTKSGIKCGKCSGTNIANIAAMTDILGLKLTKKKQHTFDIEKFISILKNVKGSDDLFNPYTDICPLNDLPNADEIRTNNLREYLKRVIDSDILIIGEAPGYLGCRRTGLPFTDERHYDLVQKKLGIELNLATDSGDFKERSALYVWEVLRYAKEVPFIWNIVPMHPHEPGKPLSNRPPEAKDYVATSEAMWYLMRNLPFSEIYAIGRHAERKLKQNHFDVKYIRHPSRGGSNEFKRDLKKYLNIKIKEPPKGVDQYF